MAIVKASKAGATALARVTFKFKKNLSNLSTELPILLKVSSDPLNAF